MGVTGRLRKVTTWVPLEKVQSVRMVTGPVQRALSLATVHVDAAGRKVRAEFRDRPGAEAAQLVEDLAALSRSARRRVPAPVSGRPRSSREPSASRPPSPAHPPSRPKAFAQSPPVLLARLLRPAKARGGVGSR